MLFSKIYENCGEYLSIGNPNLLYPQYVIGDMWQWTGDILNRENECLQMN